mgnify:CR=1 FL=1
MSGAGETTPGAVDPGLFTAPGFEQAARVFDDQIQRGLHFGAQIEVWHGDRRVLSRWGGFRDSQGALPVRVDTPFAAYSATKALTAACVHKLADEGRLDLDSPVAEYWPAFAARGKGGVTIAHVLLHQAGIPAAADLPELLAWLIPGGGARRAAARKPRHAPGEKTIYHAFTGGFVLGEVIRQVSGLSAADYLRREFLKPLGMKDSFPGLPFQELRRASGIHTADPAQIGAARVFSNPLYRRLFLPAASLNTCARDLARFYRMLCSGGELDGRRYLSSAAVERATTLRWDGPDAQSGMRIRWALGYGLGGYSPFPDRDIRHMGRGATERTFGHSGQGGCAFGWADPPSGLVFAFTCNRFQDIPGAHLRFQDLADACWEGIGK